MENITQKLLDAHFPKTLHEDIINEIGIDFHFQTIKRKRNPKFRHDVIQAYEHQCAICSCDIKLGYLDMLLEAAHIKWHQAGGPDSPDNGLALCSLHHKTFDLGAYTLDSAGRILVSERAHGTSGFDEWLLRFHGEQVRPPINQKYESSPEYIEWHIREVFKGPARQSVAS